MSIRHRPVHDKSDIELNDFVRRNCFSELSADPEFLISLSRSNDCIVDIWDGDQRVFAAVLVDTCHNATNAGEFIPLASTASPIQKDWLLLALETSELQALSGDRANIEVGLTPQIKPWRDLFMQRGYEFCYTGVDMENSSYKLAGPVAMPSGGRWTNAAKENRDALYGLMQEAFAAVPGTSLPKWSEFGARKPDSSRIDSLLTIDGIPAGFVNVRREQDGSGYINTIGRGDKFRGQGLGDILIAQALHHLAELGATSARLAVVVTNISALALLYERHGFKAIKSLEVMSKALVRHAVK